MKTLYKIIIVACIFLVILLVAIFLLSKPPSEGKVIKKPPAKQSTQAGIVKIANWNLQIFGRSKASKPDLMAKYARK